MKSKKFLLTSALISLVLVATAIPTSLIISGASNPSAPRTLTTEISPTRPGKGENVSILPDALSQFWQMDNLVGTYRDKLDEIGALTPYSDELYSWTSHLSNTESEKNIRRAIFDKYDLFRPVNNVLAWNSNIPAKGYKIIISQDKYFSTIERQYEVSGDENSIVFENPYTGVDYYWQVIATKNDDSLAYSDIFNFKTQAKPRTVKIEGVSNTRDLGGNVGLNGKKMKEGLIYRGMGLEAITTDGENEFKNQLGIKTELDLRGVGEGIENYLSLSNYYHYPSPLDYYSNSGSNMGIEWMGNGSLVASFGNAVKTLANKDNYPVYFHCAVGRDRTGWMGMCLNFLCGVDEETTFKEFALSLFSTSGALTKGHTELHSRFIRIRDYINTFSGNNLSEKMEDYLVTMAGLTHEECESVRSILLGDIDTGFVAGEVNPEPYTDLAKVTFRKYGETPIIKMVEIRSTVDRPDLGNGSWYHENDLWDFDNDVVISDMYLDYRSTDKCKVAVHYSGLNLPDGVFDVDYGTTFDLSVFARDGYTFRVYDDAFNRINSLVVTGDISINVIYSPINGYKPKSNSRIIVMAGQSNGAGVGHYQYLENSLDEAKIAEINNGYDNVLIYGYSHGDYFTDGFRKVNATRQTATAATPGTFGFEVGLADRLSKAFPDETTYILKYAHGGTSLNYDWASPTMKENISNIFPLPADYPYERGWLYSGLEESLRTAIDYISETTNTIPMVEAFMWMQGEADADLESTLDIYEESFNMLVNDFKATFEDNISYKFAVYDAAISETSLWAYPKQMNAIKKQRAEQHNDVYIETNTRLTTCFEPLGTYTDKAHYDAACYIDLGHMFADAYLSRTVKGYTLNALEIASVDKITLTMGSDYTIEPPETFFNGDPVEAKLSYFAEQHTSFSGSVYSYFKVNTDSSFTPLRVGNTELRITAFYNDEVRTILVPVEVVEA